MEVFIDEKRCACSRDWAIAPNMNRDHEIYNIECKLLFYLVVVRPSPDDYDSGQRQMTAGH